MFSRLAPRYDVFNRWASLGLHAFWRKRVVDRLHAGEDVLDLGCGTGDLALLAADKGCRVVGLDFSEEMLEIARRRGLHLEWIRAEASRIPLPDGRFDAIVSAFLLRNLYRSGAWDVTLTETGRLLKKGGRLIFLDLSLPGNPLLRLGHAVYLRTILPLVGRIAAGARWPGRYLTASIEEFPPASAIRVSLESAGFQDPGIESFCGGVVSLVTAIKT
jgi:demethylmenaquinone methyltransferase/2-methoxy-6-polyprenyl-1,4-benzoquinol methylase